MYKAMYNSYSTFLGILLFPSDIGIFSLNIDISASFRKEKVNQPTDNKTAKIIRLTIRREMEMKPP